jgi:DNA-binding LacI/PurR family transcriptional regulator
MAKRFDRNVSMLSSDLVPGPTRSPTLADVASEAGVSLSTASHAFSGTKPVSTATRERVLAAAASLGWTGPNPLARNLRRGRSGVVGIAVGQLSTAFRDPAALAMLDAVSEVLDAAGLGLLLMPDDAEVGLPLDAVIYDICGRETWGAYADLVARDVPLVVVEGPVWPGTTFIDIDHRAGAAALGRHLHDLGHRRVATLTLEASHPQREREAGLREVFPDVELIGACPSDVAAAQQAVGAWWDGGSDASAVVCQSDVQAAGVVVEARRRGLDVPGDLSVAGFDGVVLPWLDVELTTVVQPLADKGRATARAVLGRIAGEDVDDVLLPVALRIGRSTGPA